MGKSRKKRTHIQPAMSTAPRSFVIGTNLSPLARSLTRDLRATMAPNTAVNLHERPANRTRDFVHVAAQLGVTHLVVLSMAGSLNYKIGRVPRGPSVLFTVMAYSIASEVISANQVRKLSKRPAGPGVEFKTAPLVVLNNFPDTKEWALVATVIQNMYPTIQVSKTAVDAARRVILYDYADGLVQFRHYKVTTALKGVSRSVASLLNAKVPHLNTESIAGLILQGDVSEFEDDGEQENNSEGGMKEPKVQAEKQVRLVELGPRMTLSLAKIQEGLFTGRIMHHSYVAKTEDQVNALQSRKDLEEAGKKGRRDLQARNVVAKAAAKSSKSDANGQDNEELVMEGLEPEVEYDDELDLDQVFDMDMHEDEQDEDDESDAEDEEFEDIDDEVVGL